MIYLEFFVAGLITGFIAGLLVFRKNHRRFENSEIKAKEIIQALKR